MGQQCEAVVGNVVAAQTGFCLKPVRNLPGVLQERSDGVLGVIAPWEVVAGGFAKVVGVEVEAGDPVGTI